MFPVEKQEAQEGPLSLTWVQSMLQKFDFEWTKNNNTSSYMFQDHSYAFCLLL